MWLQSISCGAGAEDAGCLKKRYEMLRLFLSLVVLGLRTDCDSDIWDALVYTGSIMPYNVQP